jgi:pimeloyl-ACP methyl ester carboxylesterase
VSTPAYLDLPSGFSSALRPTSRGPLAVLHGSAAAGAGRERQETALLVPGFTGSKEDFVAVLAPLSASGYAVVALDLSGQNESPARPDGRYSLGVFADDVIALADTCPPGPVHLVGHSLGGLIGREAVLRSPRFSSLALVGSGPAALPVEQHPRLRLFAEVLAEHGPEVLWQAMQALEVEQGGDATVDPRVSAFLAERFRRNDPASLLAMVDVLVGEPSRNEELKARNIPTLVVTGERDDAWWPSVQADMAEALDARQVVISGCGHSPAVERPDETASSLTSFWAQRTGRR